MTDKIDTPALTSTTSAQLALLHHTLGLSPHQRGSFRNYFLAGTGHHDLPNLLALVDAGLMTRDEAPSWVGKDELFRVTDAGRKYAHENMPPVPTPAKYSRYEQYLRADCGGTFAEWLGIEVPRREYAGYRHSTNHHIRLVSSKVTGGWAPTLKEAKALYKKALAATKADTHREYSFTSLQPA